MYVLLFFFFQAEDGIRDLVRSRGLGDVYKRQTNSLTVTATGGTGTFTYQWQVGSTSTGPWTNVGSNSNTYAVSYTHLTLPTSDLV